MTLQDEREAGRTQSRCSYENTVDVKERMSKRVTVWLNKYVYNGEFMQTYVIWLRLTVFFQPFINLLQKLA